MKTTTLKKKGSDGSGKLEKRWVEYTDKSYKALISAPVKKINSAIELLKHKLKIYRNTETSKAMPLEPECSRLSNHHAVGATRHAWSNQRSKGATTLIFFVELNWGFFKSRTDSPDNDGKPTECSLRSVEPFAHRPRTLVSSWHRPQLQHANSNKSQISLVSAWIRLDWVSIYYYSWASKVF